MRELHGLVFAGHRFLNLKHQALLFDKFYIWQPENFLHVIGQQSQADLDFLRSKNVVANAPTLTRDHPLREGVQAVLVTMDDAYVPPKRPPDSPDSYVVVHQDQLFAMHNMLTAVFLSGIPLDTSYDVVPIYEQHKFMHIEKPVSIELVTHVSLQCLPVPDETSSWHDIIDFKADMHDKQWGFRRWLKSLTTKNLTQAEIRDEIEWTLNEYTRAMKIHDIKTSYSAVEAYVITPLEIIENLIKFDWSKIAKGMLSIKKRPIELLEAEMKAPGRECAYVLDARRRFG